MLDRNSASILHALNKLAEGNAYKVITGDEIMAKLSQKSHFDLEIIKQILDFLEKQQYINIKFSEENTYCYSLLPKAKIYIEQEESKANPQKSNKEILKYVYIMISSFIGTMFALLIFFYLTF